MRSLCNLRLVFVLSAVVAPSSCGEDTSKRHAASSQPEGGQPVVTRDRGLSSSRLQFIGSLQKIAEIEREKKNHVAAESDDRSQRKLLWREKTLKKCCYHYMCFPH